MSKFNFRVGSIVQLNVYNMTEYNDEETKEFINKYKNDVLIVSRIREDVEVCPICVKCNDDELWCEPNEIILLCF